MPALAGAAPAGAIRPDAPEKPHLGVPQALTSTSRKSSPKAPGDTHRSLPNALTDASRNRSPMLPGKAHQRLPQVLTGCSREGSPNALDSARTWLPKNLTFVTIVNFREERSDECVRTHRAEQTRSSCIAPCCTPPPVPRKTDSLRVQQAPARWCALCSLCNTQTICIPDRLWSSSAVQAGDIGGFATSAACCGIRQTLRLQLHPEAHDAGLLRRRYGKAACFRERDHRRILAQRLADHPCGSA
ncbi:hypothetical protein BPA30113_03606 [Burkholderia paludis]|uniref:Uncharacterized protein n=1 Tax=Burkholderia paludis TaxID=1506587 RepID=A0A6P2M1Z3_9BURK|nr:hypothetical protein LMG30113_02126 [Burkholderia paludis]VWB78868.1 hypothetical protein BPA30113_03606 [Burkholderia paludis]